MNRRNFIRQVIICKDGTKKIIWHKKKFNAPEYLDRKSFWKQSNMIASENSKRQQKLREKFALQKAA
jgi:hypothetical protein